MIMKATVRPRNTSKKTCRPPGALPTALAMPEKCMLDWIRRVREDLCEVRHANEEKHPENGRAAPDREEHVREAREHADRDAAAQRPREKGPAAPGHIAQLHG